MLQVSELAEKRAVQKYIVKNITHNWTTCTVIVFCVGGSKGLKVL